MIKIRSSCFETNSSSTHCIVITTKDEWKRFKNNKLVLNLYNGELRELNEQTDPIVLEGGKVQYSGKIYSDIFEVPAVWDISNTIYEYFREYSTDTVEKNLNDKLIIAIYTDNV